MEQTGWLCACAWVLVLLRRTFRRAVEVDDKLVLAIILSLYIVVTHHAARVENKREGREQRRGE